MEVSVSQADLDLLTNYYRFCRGYTLPDDVMLSDVLEALKDALEIRLLVIEFETCSQCGDKPGARAVNADIITKEDRIRALLAKFKKED